MTEYTHKTYDTMRVYVPAGMYSIAEIDQLLADMIEAKKQQDEHLKAAMQSLKEDTCTGCQNTSADCT